jgi:putative oxidoreductase
MGEMFLRTSATQGKWFGGEPIWVTAEKAGIRTAAYFWTGSEAEIQGVRPSQWKLFDATVADSAKLGQVMKYLGITFAPVVWGFLAAMSEFFGGLGLVVGGLFRYAAFFLVCTMLVATIQHFARGDGYAGGAFHSVEMGIVCLSLFLMGPGKYSLDERLRR